jgi:hypothetical protein
MAYTYSERGGKTGPEGLAYKDLSFIGNLVAQEVNLIDLDYNLISFIQYWNLAELISQQTPSGWLLKLDRVFDFGNSGSIIAPSGVENIIRLNGLGYLEDVIVNGFKLKFGGTNDINNSISLNAPPSTGARTDLIFLEVWIKEIQKPDSSNVSGRRLAGLMDDGKYCPYGNTQYYDTGYDYDKEHSGLDEMNRRLQFQYRVRVVGGNDGIYTESQGVDSDIYVEGIDDPLVKAWPTNKRLAGDGIGETSYNYSLSNDDDGLYIAGDGSDDAKTNLKTVDGYIYAIPICMIHRRNFTAYNLDTNPNGAESDDTNQSDRPDGLYSTIVVPADIIDLRHRITLNQLDFEEMIDESLSLLMKGKLQTSFVSGDGYGISNSVKGTEFIYCEQFGGIAPFLNNVNVRTSGNNLSITEMAPDGQRRIWTDDNYAQFSHSIIPQSQLNSLPTDITYGAWRSSGSGTWKINHIITITVPTWATIDVGDGVEIYEDGDYTEVSSDFNIVQTNSYTLTLTLTSTPSWTSVSNLHVNYTVNYPNGGGMINLPNKILKIEDSNGLLLWGNDLSEENSYKDFGSQWNKNVIFDGVDFGQHGAYYRVQNITVSVQDQVTVTLPSGMKAVGVLSLTKIEGSDIRTSIENTIRFWQQSGDAVVLDLDGSVNEGDIIEVELYVDKSFALFDKSSKSIVSIYETKEVEVIIIGGTGRYYFEDLEYAYHIPSNMIDGVANIKVVDANGGNIAQHGIVSGTVSPEEWYVEVSDVPYVNVNDGGTVKITLTVEKTIKNDDFLRFCYNYTPYQGIVQNWASQASRWWKFKNHSGMSTRGTGYLDVSNFVSFNKLAILPHFPGRRSYDYLSGEDDPTNLMLAGSFYETATIIDSNLRVSQLNLIGEDVGVQFNFFKFLTGSIVSNERGYTFNTSFFDKGLEEIYPDGISIYIGLSLSDRLDTGVTWEDTKKIRMFLAALSNDSTPTPDAYYCRFRIY